ncbi:insulinase family protein [Massilia sp. H-1]|nr:insulinase family protein [Massilia sp. H-1]
MLRTPSFPEAEFAEMQREQVNAIQQQMPEPQALAENAMARLLDATPDDHVSHVRTLEQQLAQLKTLTVAQVRAFHQQFYGANNVTMAVVGDFDAAALKSQAERLFGNWNAVQPFVRMPVTIRDVTAQKVAIDTPDKANSTLFASLPLSLKDDAEDYPALMLANHILGGGALHSRIADRIRQKDGLSYGVGSYLSVRTLDPAAKWGAYAISAPENTAKVEAALLRRNRARAQGWLHRSGTGGRKKGWRQAEEVGRTDDGALAYQLANYLYLKRTMAYDQALEAKVAALKLAQVNAALRKYVDPGKMSVVSAGRCLSKAAAAAKGK